MQIRAVMVPFRIERRRRDSRTMLEFRERARSILAPLDDEVGRYPDLEALLLEARQELDFGVDETE